MSEKITELKEKLKILRKRMNDCSGDNYDPRESLNINAQLRNVLMQLKEELSKTENEGEEWKQ